jgi:hypothetical protein
MADTYKDLGVVDIIPPRPAAGSYHVYVLSTDDTRYLQTSTGEFPMSSTVAGGYEVDQLTYTDTANKIIGPLSSTPADVTSTNLDILRGVRQEYILAYTVRQVIGGSAPGYYVCISPTSTAPGGGAFSGGNNRGSGIRSKLTSGDKVRVSYPT